MLDQTTKRKIDSARNILVGKVPDPKAQVEQITTALVYKFMDDMDKESEELGGKARFFTNSFSQYSWTKILDKKLSGQERLDLYVQAITNMSKNPHIPQLFRDIFKGAFLPFRDPRTLTLFLKEINEFSYDHSEDLGNAFEYLLSILGSQGDAGQFRTPRHIIDFTAEVVDPKKNETILDPACGTAGFLISAYKHILKNHDGLDNKTGKPTNKEKNLTPDEKTKLMNNIVGYDISPDMVKLSLVNMYLHGFQNPKIHEYDTLTSEKRWDETFDVIMANPPFMTPKGGIQPHKRFSIKANRAEVLFVDYIMDHLNIAGKAGIIVPDGIVSNKNSSAYSALRKKLVEDNFVYAVVSLHHGVFKPYADVKTSIILIDRTLAKKTKDILFLDIDNDGYEKGNRKREIAENDIYEVVDLLKEYKKIIDKEDQINTFEKHNAKVFLVSKNEIKKDNHYILRSNKYRASVSAKSNLPVEALEKHILEVKQKNNDEDAIVFSVSKEKGFIDSEDFFNASVKSQNTKNYKIVKNGDIVFNPARANVGSIAINDTGKTGVVSPMYTVFRVKKDSDLVPEYLFHLLTSKRGIEQINILSSGAVRQTLKMEDLLKFEIPIPPLSFQKSFKNNHLLIKNASKVVEEYEAYIKIDPKWNTVKLTDYFELEKGSKPIQKTPKGKYSLVTTGEQFSSCDSYDYDCEAICVPLISSAGHGKALLNRIYYVNGKFSVGNILMSIIPKKEKSNLINVKFYYHLLSQEKDNLFTNLMYGTSNVSFAIDDCKDIQIPLPSKKDQDLIMRKIENEKNLISVNKDLVKLFVKKIDDKISEIWGK